MHPSVIHDPYAGSTPSQRLAAAARAMRQGRIAAKAVTDIPLSCRPLPVTEIQQTASPSFNDWARRQERLNPLPKAPWFSIEAEIDAPPRKIQIKEIQVACAKFYRVSVDDLVSERRQDYIVLPRHVAMYLAKTLTPHTLPEIGRRFGHRDHTSILFAVRKIAGLIASYVTISAEVERIKALILEVA